MTWLLNQLQKILGALPRRRNSPQASDSTQLGSEIASRLQSSNAANGSESVAVRDQGKSLEPVSPIQSTAPLRQKNSSVLKDTVDPVAAEPDTHQRLDVAPASLPGGTSSAPSFPTDVSDLISAQSSQPPVLKGNLRDSLPMPDNLPPTVSDEELPDIHDLLPAIEPEPIEPEPSDDLPSVSATVTDDENLSLDDALGADSVAISDVPIVESAQRVSVSDQATLFSFDIVETDAAVEGSLAAKELVDSNLSGRQLNESEPVEPSFVNSEVTPESIEDNPLDASLHEAVLPTSTSQTATPVDQEPLDSNSIIDLADANLLDNSVVSTMTEVASASTALEEPIISQVPVANLPIVESLIPDTLLSDLSVQISDKQAVVDAVSVEDLPASEERLEASSADVQNPWLTAVPARQKESVPERAQETSIKNGTVKLLFKLKEGNFHGYIAPEDGSKDILFHQKYINADIFEYIDRGTQVVVTVKHMEGKAYATRVDLLQK